MQDQAFIGRQAILDKQQKIVAYELLFRHSGTATTAEITDDVHAGTRVIANAFGNMGSQWVLGDKFAFINIATPMLESEFLELLPARQVVLEILETVLPTPELIQRCKELRAMDFRLALDDYEHTPEMTPFLDVVDFVKLDIQKLGPVKTAETVKILKNYPVKLVAEKVETHGEFKGCKNLDFDFYQGYYFAHPETLTAKIINPAHANVLQLLNQVRKNEDIKDIELAFKRDVALSFKLLRYINSVGFGLSCEIQSIKHAVSILGYQQLYRWLTLLLVTAGTSESTPPALMKTAVTRGRLTELLGQDHLDKNDRDNLFIVGVFSLLDAMLEMPMESVLDKLSLPENIADALLTRQGIYGPFLELTEACEGTDVDRIESLAEALQLEPDAVNKAHFEALAWVETLGI
ncbi:EAL and HDOD domain-containing protein [Sulfurirhabdus autotrophica]|uniref:EAL and modified HD-GYP domain-containing signal transduction protein n=1 Tax=Sulfurirhabdus autotrophica TaxID=1706046 RepID=A0A4R3YFT4_9PROT|nr:EAL domain-containing protein [Sulfurirhabdus autotrophica]TCV90792.1 EAL and modified HD-GYP domain-containing signal transduction protein [Sulfurirhabdus autotrophica]